MMILSTWLSELSGFVRSLSGGTAEEVRLEAETIWTLPARSGDWILLCEEGQIWVTEEGAPADLILRSGEGCRLQRKGLRIVQAFVRSKFIACALTHRHSSFRRTDPAEWLRPR